MNPSVPPSLMHNSTAPPPSVLDSGYPSAPPHLQPLPPQHLHHPQHHEQLSTVPHPPVLEPETSLNSDPRRMDYDPPPESHPEPPAQPSIQSPPCQGLDLEQEHDLDSQPSEIESQEEQPEDQESRMETDFQSAPDSEEPAGDRTDNVRPEPEPETEVEFDKESSDKEPELDRYGDTEEADIEDADIDEPEQDTDNHSLPRSPVVMLSPLGEPPPTPDRCSSNSDEAPPTLTAELPTEPLNTSVFNFTEDEEPPPPLHMSVNGSPRRVKIPR